MRLNTLFLAVGVDRTAMEHCEGEIPTHSLASYTLYSVV